MDKKWKSVETIEEKKVLYVVIILHVTSSTSDSRIDRFVRGFVRFCLSGKLEQIDSILWSVNFPG